jgi:hypothetical protein
LIYSIYDSREEAIRKMIEASQRMIRDEQNNGPSLTKHVKLQIRHFKMRLERCIVGTAVESKTKGKARGDAHRGHTKVSYRN